MVAEQNQRSRSDKQVNREGSFEKKRWKLPKLEEVRKNKGKEKVKGCVAQKKTACNINPDRQMVRAGAV